MSESTGPALLAYDGSESSATAIAVAGRLLSGRRALVCHAWTGLTQPVMFGMLAKLPDALGDAAAELDWEEMREAERTAAEGVRLARAAGFDAEPLLARRERKTWRALLEAAEREQTSVIVVGAHGMSGIGRAVLGSVSTALIHQSRVAILVVPRRVRRSGTRGRCCFATTVRGRRRGPSPLRAACLGRAPPSWCISGSPGSRRRPCSRV